MAGNTSNVVTYYVRLPLSEKHLLGAMRHWENVKIGYDGNDIWLKDIDAFQAEAAEVKTIPAKEIYYSHDGKLFLKGSLLPERNIPSLLWTSLERGLQLNLPAFNHNYFGINDALQVKIVVADTEYEAFASLISLQILQDYLVAAPEIRTKHLQWIIMDDHALVTGNPLLPLPGKVFWRRNDHLLPAGFDFELYALSNVISKTIDPESKHWIIWARTGQYSLIPKHAFAKLTRASLRSTVKESA